MTDDNICTDLQQRRQLQRLCQECSSITSHHDDKTARRPALYQCPRCFHLTCSLACCRAHKVRLGCNGKRDKTKFLPVSQMNDRTLQSDYHFLEDIVGTVDAGQRLLKHVGAAAATATDHNRNKRPRPADSTQQTAATTTTEEEPCAEPPHTLLLQAAAAVTTSTKRRIVVSPQQHHQHQQQHVPAKWRTFQRFAAERSTTVLFMPLGMARHQSNKSHVKKGDTLQWTIEWCFHNDAAARPTPSCNQRESSLNEGPEMKPLSASSSSSSSPTTTTTTTTKITLTPETAVVGDILLQTLLASSSNNSTDDFSILLKKLPCPSHQPLYIEIAPSATVRDALQHVTVYEYPTFHIVPNSRSAQAHFPRLISAVPDDFNDNNGDNETN